MDFATHIAFEEVVLGSQGTFIASHAALTRWHEAELVSFDTMVGSRGACIALCEARIGSQRIFVVSHRTLSRWHEAELVSVETVISSRRACLASHEAVIGSQRTFVVSAETCFQEVAIGALAVLTFLCLRTCRGLATSREMFKPLGQSE